MTLVSDLVMFAGCALVFVSAIGLHRFNDVFARMHAGGKAPSLGFILVAAGALVRGATAATTAQLLLTAGLLLVTVPIGTTMLARAAYRSGDQLSPETEIDELADDRAGPDPGGS